MKHEITTQDDADQVLDFFNDFHDGFIQALTLMSGDEMKPNGTQVCTGDFTVQIDFAHENYGPSGQPDGRIVHADFRDVRDFHLDLRDVGQADWTILVLDVEGSGADRLLLKMVYAHLDGQSWQEQKVDLFTFSTATLEERQANQ